MAIRTTAVICWKTVRRHGVAFLVAGAIGLVAPATVSGQLTTFQDIPAGLDYYMPAPENYPPAGEAMIALGRQLFFDPMLSRDSSLACASCHIPSRAFTNAQAVSQGVFGRPGHRNVPTLINRGWGQSFFWDGRSSTLEHQVLQPIQATTEMDLSIEEVVRRLRDDPEYAITFVDVLNRAPNREGLAQALAVYVRSIRAGDSPFDRLVDGDLEALTERQHVGLRLFQGLAGCSRCHNGPLFTDERFHNTGVAWRDGELIDQGRFVVSGSEEDRGAFKTPTLREVERTGPYMHDGSLATLEEVVEFYNRGGNANPHLDHALRPLDLTDDEKEALVAYLRSLSGRVLEGTAGVPPS